MRADCQCGPPLDATGPCVGGQDIENTLGFYDTFDDDDGTSMLYDLLSGRSLEHDLVNGAVVRLGARHGIPTPVNQALYALLDALGPAVSTCAARWPPR